MNDYFKPREGLHALNVDLHTRSCKIAFLGNSITAQKEGYAYQLASQINDYFLPNHEFIYAGIGGVGSLASCFLMDDFVVRYKPDICFVECTVADIGYATPPQYIKPAVEGIIQKLIASSTQICFLHLFNTHTSANRADEIIEDYEEVLAEYKIPSINVREKICAGIRNSVYHQADILYDGVHTTKQGAIIYAEAIMEAFIPMLSLKTDLRNLPDLNFSSKFRYTQIVLPESLLSETSLNLVKSRFRGLIKYVQIDNEYVFKALLTDGVIVGFFIIADDSSGVLHVSYEENSLDIQTYDQWCHKERIQAVILDEPVAEFQDLNISLSRFDCAERGANGSTNKCRHIGSTWKLVGLMVAYTQEPSVKTKLW